MPARDRSSAGRIEVLRETGHCKCVPLLLILELFTPTPLSSNGVTYARVPPVRHTQNQLHIPGDGHQWLQPNLQLVVFNISESA
jgi:hypothetical protein